MQIHDRRDQLIYSLAGLQATIWVGLFSVGFWEGNESWHFRFWTAMMSVTLCMLGQFFSLIACYYYPKAIEDSSLLKKSDRREAFWRFFWNLHWKWFFVGAISSIAATVFRFLG
jgi:hypothetical protein